MCCGDVVDYSFKVCIDFKELLEKYCNKVGIPTSKFIQDAVLCEMILNGNYDAIQYVSNKTGDEPARVIKNLLNNIK